MLEITFWITYNKEAYKIHLWSCFSLSQIIYFLSHFLNFVSISQTLQKWIFNDTFSCRLLEIVKEIILLSSNLFRKHYWTFSRWGTGCFSIPSEVICPIIKQFGNFIMLVFISYKVRGRDILNEWKETILINSIAYLLYGRVTNLY